MLDLNLYLLPETSQPVAEPVKIEQEQPVLEKISTSDSNVSPAPRKNCFKIVFDKSIAGFNSLPGDIKF